ncbi:MAG: hypothetical protein AAFV88_08315 [Planctomycetota bacterium]
MCRASGGRVLLLLLVVGFLLGPLNDSVDAQSIHDEGPPARTDELIRAEIERLSDSSFVVRNRALENLRRIGREAQTAVRDAASSHPDAEVRERAKALNADFELGIFGDVPPPVVAAIRNAESKAPNRARQGIVSLLRLKELDRAIGALKRKPNRAARVSLSSAFFEASPFQSRLLEPNGFQSLRDVLFGNGGNPNTNEWNLMFTGAALNAISDAGLLNPWLELSKLQGDQISQTRWVLLAKNASALKAWMKLHRDAPIKKLLDSPERDSTRNTMVQTLANNHEVMNEILRSGTLTTLLDAANSPADVLASAIAVESVDELVISPSLSDWMTAVSKADQASRLRVLSLVHQSARIGERGQLVTASVELARQFDEHPDKQTFSDWAMLRVKDLQTKSVQDREFAKRFLARLLLDRTSWRQADWHFLLRSDVAWLLPTEPVFTSLLTRLESLPPAELASVCKLIRQSPPIAKALLADDATPFFRVLDRLSSDRKQPVMPSIVSLLEQLDSDQLPQVRLRFIERIKASRSAEQRFNLLTGMVASRRLWVGLPPANLAEEAERRTQPTAWFQSVGDLIDSIKERKKQSVLWASVIGFEGTVDAMIACGRENELRRYSDDSVDSETRAAFLQAILHSPDAIEYLFSQGEGARLERAIGRIEATDARSKSLTLFLRQPPVIEQRIKDGRFAEIRENYFSSDAEQRYHWILAFENATATPWSENGFVTEVWEGLLDHDTKTQRWTRQTFQKLSQSQRFMQALAATGDDSELLQMADQLLGTLSEAWLVGFFHQERGTEWLKRFGIDPILQFSKQRVDTPVRTQPLGLIEVPAIAKAIEEAERWPDVAELLRDAIDAWKEDPRNHLFPRLHGELGRGLIESGEFGFLIEMALEATEDELADQTMQIFASGAFGIRYRSKQRLENLLERIASISSQARRIEVVSQLISNPTIARAMEQFRLFDPILAFCVDAEKAPTIERLQSILLTGAPAKLLRDDSFLQVFDSVCREASRRREPNGRVKSKVVVMVLRSEIAAKRLFALGREPQLFEWAENLNNDGFYFHPIVYKAANPILREQILDRVDRYFEVDRTHPTAVLSHSLLGPWIESRGLEQLLAVVSEAEIPEQYWFQLWSRPDALAALVKRREWVQSAVARPRSRQKYFGSVHKVFDHPECEFVFESPEALRETLAFMSTDAGKESAWINELTRARFLDAYARAGLIEELRSVHPIRPSSQRHLQRGPTVDLREPVYLDLAGGRVESAVSTLRGQIDSPDRRERLIGLLTSTNRLNQEIERLEAAADSRELTPPEIDLWIMSCRAAGDQNSALAVAKRHRHLEWQVNLHVEAGHWKQAYETAQELWPLESQRTEPASDDPRIQLDHVSRVGLLALYANQVADWTKAASLVDAIADAHEASVKVEHAASDHLILLRRVPQAIARLKQSPWRAFHLIEARGFYEPALNRIAWGKKSPADYYDGASSEKPITSMRRNYAMVFHLDVAKTLRKIGWHEQADELMLAIANFVDAHSDLPTDSSKTVSEEQASQNKRLVSRANSLRNVLAANLLIQQSLAARDDAPTAWSDSLRNQLAKTPSWREAFQRADDDLVDQGRHTRLARDLFRVCKTADPMTNPEEHKQSIRSALSGKSNPLFLRFVIANTQHSAFRRSNSSTLVQFLSEWPDGSLLEELDEAVKGELQRTVTSADLFRTAITSDPMMQQRVAWITRAAATNPHELDLRWLHDCWLAKTDDSPQSLTTNALTHEPRVRLAIADLLLRMEQTDAALAVCREVVRCSLPNSKHAAEALEKLTSYEPDSAKRYQYARQWILALLSDAGRFGRKTELLDARSKLHQIGMEAGIAAGNVETVRAHWVAALAVNPDSNQWCTELVEKLRKVEMPALADEFLQQRKQFVAARRKKFPSGVWPKPD